MKMESPESSGKANFEPSLSKLDFDFEKISDAEVVPCCLWEYGRESWKVQELVRRIKENDSVTAESTINVQVNRQAIKRRDELVGKAQEIEIIDTEISAKRAVEVGRDLAHCRKIVDQAMHAVLSPLKAQIAEIDAEFDRVEQELKVAISGGPVPSEKRLQELQQQLRSIKAQQTAPRVLFWRGLLKSRSNIVSLATDGSYFNPSLPFPVPWLSLAPEARRRLSGFWPLITSRKSGKGSKVLAPQDPIGGNAFSAPSDVETAGAFRNEPPDFAVLTGQFRIKWNFVDEEIVASFRNWLKTNRPLFSVSDDRRGHDLDHFRVALRRLGTMRRINSDPTYANAERNKDAKRVLMHFSEFVKIGLVCDGDIPQDCEPEYPLNWPAQWE